MIYCENIVNVTLFFLLSPDFEPHFPPPIFGNAIVTIVTIFFFPLSTISLSIFFFFSLRALHAHLSHPGSRIGHRKFGISVAKIQHFLPPPFSSSLSYFWLNFSNDNTEIQTLSSKSQISLNSSYNAN